MNWWLTSGFPWKWSERCEWDLLQWESTFYICADECTLRCCRFLRTDISVSVGLKRSELKNSVMQLQFMGLLTLHSHAKIQISDVKYRGGCPYASLSSQLVSLFIFRTDIHILEREITPCRFLKVSLNLLFLTYCQVFNRVFTLYGQNSYSRQGM